LVDTNIWSDIYEYTNLFNFSSTTASSNLIIWWKCRGYDKSSDIKFDLFGWTSDKYNDKMRIYIVMKGRTNIMIEIEVKIDRLIWQSSTNDFKIYSANPVNNDDVDLHNLKFNDFQNLSLNGAMPKLDVGQTYNVRVIEKKHPKYGIGYEVQQVYQNVPTTVEEQKAYLSTLLTEIQVNNIYDVYGKDEDIIQLMKDDKFDFNKVKGMGEHTYNIVKIKIIENLELQTALIELSKFGLTYNMISKLVRRYGSASLVVEKVTENIYVLTEVEGIGFLKCDAYALNMGIEPTSTYRIEACVQYVLSEEADGAGHSWVGKDALINKCSDMMKIDKRAVQDYINNYNGRFLYIDEDKVARANLYDYEVRIKESIVRLLSDKPKKIENLENLIDKAEEKQGFKFTDEQRNAISVAVQSNFVVITGKAGTGKTTILKGVINVLRESGEFEEYFTCALSGKASQRIAESTGLQSSTIHRLLGWNRESGGFNHDLDKPLPKSVVVLDEASMVNTYLGCSLAEAVPTGAKLIIQGDVEQLEAIGAGNFFKDMIDSNVIPVAHLTQVHRQALRSGILSTANSVREGEQFTKKDDYDDRVIGELKDLYFKPYRKVESVKKSILKTCKQYLKAPNFDLLNFQVIVPLKNRGEIATKKLNIELQEIFNPEMKPIISRNGYDFKEGDKVIQQGNNYDYEVFNGTLGIIKEVNTIEKEVVISFVGVGDIKYNQEELSQIDMAYALTVHRVQGSQFDNVVIGLDFSAYVLLSRQLIYTALTRASKLAFLICENDALLHAVRTDKASTRNTFLKQLLEVSLT
jgi:exodeoxyribonuclease V alpha subunit